MPLLMNAISVQTYNLPPSISNNESVAISWLRAIGALFIVICHIYQSLDNNLCLLFNVGVQMFFFISGFLYGKKEIINIRSWFAKRAKRVLVPYYVLIVSMIVVLLATTHGLINWGYVSYFLGLQGFIVLGGGRITALNHLWFITFILLCYVLTPILQWIDKKHPWMYIVVLLGCLGARFFPYCQLANWTACYIVGYILARRNWIYNTIITWVCLLSCLILFVLSNEDIFSYYSRYYLAWHYIIGVSVCVLTLNCFNVVRQQIKLNSLIKKLDDLSYEIFLVNFIPLVGEFSLIQYGPSLLVNIMLVLCLIVISSIILKYVSNTVMSLMERLKRTNEESIVYKQNKKNYERKNY